MRIYIYLPVILLLLIISFQIAAGSESQAEERTIIAITSNGTSLDSEVSQNFGRCQYFLFYNYKEETLTVVENPGVEMQSGAGRNAAELVINNGADYVVTGNVGGNVESRLKGAGIQIVTGLTKSTTVKEAIEMVRSGL